AGEEAIRTPCGKGGAYHKLWERGAAILLIGVNYTRNTFIHGIEEWDGAEEAVSGEATDLYVINEEGRRIHTPQYRHCNRLGSSTFVKLEAEAIEKGVLRLGTFGDATARVMGAAPLRDMVAARLRADPRYLLRH
ncbi:MAG: AAC(3) family N-acetyltransferase, partial [Oscillospiraceae bacterium]|nr:AAC(3) family N-acetyltransferase [Oscillospiraceae bacterium]